MDLKGCAFTTLRNWYTSQEKIVVYYDHETKYFQIEIVEDGVTIGRADSLMEGMETARSYVDAMDDITGPEIRAYITRVQMETAIKLGLPGLGDRSKKVLSHMLDVCTNALGKDRYLD
jgi:hypothetical protein